MKVVIEPRSIVVAEIKPPLPDAPVFATDGLSGF
jgi:hypothetical protein